MTLAFCTRLVSLWEQGSANWRAIARGGDSKTQAAFSGKVYVNGALCNNLCQFFMHKSGRLGWATLNMKNVSEETDCTLTRWPDSREVVSLLRHEDPKHSRQESSFVQIFLSPVISGSLTSMVVSSPPILIVSHLAAFVQGQSRDTLEGGLPRKNCASGRAASYRTPKQPSGLV